MLWFESCICFADLETRYLQAHHYISALLLYQIPPPPALT